MEDTQVASRSIDALKKKRVSRRKQESVGVQEYKAEHRGRTDNLLCMIFCSCELKGELIRKCNENQQNVTEWKHNELEFEG